MARWLRFARSGKVSFGTLGDDDNIAVHGGDMFAGATATGESVALADVAVLTPCAPSKMICLWNNFHQLAAKMNVAEPAEPLFFIKAASSYLAAGGTIRRPAGYDGKVVYEGELGIVIGKRSSGISEAEAVDNIFGYTCVNDVAAADILKKDATFDQWVRAKSYDTFGVFGPCIATGLDPAGLSVKTVLNGAERQNYAVADMIFQPAKLVSMLSHDMTLMPGDVIACGTSLGVGSMKEPENSIEISIEGIGTLANVYVN